MKQHFQFIFWFAIYLHCGFTQAQTREYGLTKWDTLIVMHQIPLAKYPKIRIDDESKSLITESGGYVFRVQSFFEKNCFDDEMQNYFMCEKIDTLNVVADSIIKTDWGKSLIIFERNKKRKLERKDILSKITSGIDDIISSKEVYFNEDKLKDLVVFCKEVNFSYSINDEREINYNCIVFLNNGNGYEPSIIADYENLPETICVTNFKIKGMSMIIAFEDWSRFIENGYQLEIVKMKVGSD
jgi:hypothetical protein